MFNIARKLKLFDLFKIAKEIDLDKIKRNDIITVYHGTSISNIFDFINGFDATKVVPRLYSGPRHRGLFVTPSFETARRFSNYGSVVLEIDVRAANLHGTNYSGVIGRESGDGRYWKDKYKESFRPLLSETLQQSVEPQALLIGLVSPKQIKRIWYSPNHYRGGEGNWYTREEFFDLNLEVDPIKGGKRVVKNLEVDRSYPNYSFDEFIDAIVIMLDRDIDRDRVIKTLALRAHISAKPDRSDTLEEMIIRVGFEPLPAKRYADRFRDKFIKIYEDEKAEKI